MGFRATPLSISTLLLIALDVWVIYMLTRRKSDSNLPLIFYLFLFVYTRVIPDSMNSYLFFAGVVLALILRFEFMNRFFTKMVLLAEMCALLLIGWILLGQVFGPGLTPF